MTMAKLSQHMQRCLLSVLRAGDKGLPVPCSGVRHNGTHNGMAGLKRRGLVEKRYLPDRHVDVFTLTEAGRRAAAQEAPNG